MKRPSIIILIVVVLLVGVTAVFKEPPVIAQSINTSSVNKERQVEREFSNKVKTLDSLVDEFPDKPTVKTVFRRKTKKVYVKPSTESVVVLCDNKAIETEISRIDGKLTINADSVCKVAMPCNDLECQDVKPKKRSLFKRIFNR